MDVAWRIDDITGEIVDAALTIHKAWGPGLRESTCEQLLAAELLRRGLGVQRQVLKPLEARGIRIERSLRLDLLVEEQVVVEIKSRPWLDPNHARQLLTYLRALDLRVGLLINFGLPTLKQGLRRVVNDYRG